MLVHFGSGYPNSVLGRVGSHLAIFAIGGQGLGVQAMGL